MYIIKNLHYLPMENTNKDISEDANDKNITNIEDIKDSYINITLKASEYEKLLRDSKILDALRKWGIDVSGVDITESK